MDTYKTISALSEGIYKEKGSKFISFAFPVNNVEEVKEIVKEFQKKYFDARHVCYAYMIGQERETFRANDDGEPSGTAGRPILGQINSHNLTNILVIVVRYFGGVLLGTGGLVVAYKEATLDAINNAEIIEKVVEESISIQFGYLQMNEIMKILKDSTAQITNQKFDNDCSIILSIRKQEYEALKSKLGKITEVKIE